MEPKIPGFLPGTRPALPAELLECVLVIALNESECRMLTGIEVRNKTSMKRAADILMKRGVGSG